MTQGQETGSVRSKVVAIFREMATDRVSTLDGLAKPEIVAIIGKALGSDHTPEVARDIGFHICDWKLDAAFVVAVHLFPERFTSNEIRAGVIDLVVHAPNHMAAAAKLAGHPIEDIFDVGALSGD